MFQKCFFFFFFFCDGFKIDFKKRTNVSFLYFFVGFGLEGFYGLFLGQNIVKCFYFFIFIERIFEIDFKKRANVSFLYFFVGFGFSGVWSFPWTGMLISFDNVLIFALRSI